MFYRHIILTLSLVITFLLAGGSCCFAASETSNFDMLQGVNQNPKATIKYLQDKPDKNLSEQAQLLALWQIYNPEKIKSKQYQEIAQSLHQSILTYLNNHKNWQASWRDEEYHKTVGDNYQSCYADMACLLNAFPYWMSWKNDIWTDFYLPCKIARKYHKIFYFDTAGGGHGSQTFLISDCNLDAKFSFPPETEAYFDNLNINRLPNSRGSNRFFLSALWIATTFNMIYDPDFKSLPDYSANNLIPSWALESYYNWKTFNNVINFGIGYKQALESLTQHYLTTFNVSQQQAFNAAMIALKPPALEYGGIDDSNHANYLVLSNAPMNEITPLLNEDNCLSLLSLAIASPDLLQNIIKECRILIGEEQFNIDNPNDFNKTPLMYAAQFNFLESVKILLKNKAEINHQTDKDDCYSFDTTFCMLNSQRTALIYATQEGNYEIVKYLLSQGADINLADSQGMTAYDYLLGKAPENNPYKASGIYDGSSVYKDKKIKPPFTAAQFAELKKLLVSNKNSQP